jgi:hypothetical protein
VSGPPEKRRSRRGWPGPLSTAGVGKGHTHQLPRSLLAILKAMVGAVVVLAVMVGLLTYYVLQQQQYIQGRGVQRDIENERTNERINDAICDLLDQLPEGGLLERPREKYGCGAGIPLDELPADIRDRYQGRRPSPTPTPAAPTSAAAAPPMGSPAIPNPPRSTPYFPPMEKESP